MGTNNYYEIDNLGRRLLNLHLLLFSIKQEKSNIIKYYAPNMNPLHFILLFLICRDKTKAEGWVGWDREAASLLADANERLKMFLQQY